MWDDRVRVISVTSNDKDNVEELMTLLSNDISVDSLRTYIKSNSIDASARTLVYQKGENVNADAMEWKEGVVNKFESSVDNTTQIIKIIEVRPAEPKAFKEAKGLITSAYQAELETLWLQQLKEKYPVKVNEKVLEKIKNNY